MSEQLSPEQRAELALKDGGVWLNCWEFHSLAKDIASAIRAAVEAERARTWTPPEAAWDGLARDIVMWHDCYANKLTPRTLFKHLDLVGTEVPQWLRDEPEMQNLDHTISKGTRAVIIHRAMLDAIRTPTTEATHG